MFNVQNIAHNTFEMFNFNSYTCGYIVCWKTIRQAIENHQLVDEPDLNKLLASETIPWPTDICTIILNLNPIQRQVGLEVLLNATLLNEESFINFCMNLYLKNNIQHSSAAKPSKFLSQHFFTSTNSLTDIAKISDDTYIPNEGPAQQA